MVATSGRYGYHRDELYFLTAGQRLDWGYPDQPPLVPLLARLLDTGSVAVLRFPSAVSTAVVVLLTGLVAKRLGARASGQWLACLGTLMGGLVVGVGHLLSTSTFLVLGTVVVLYLVIVIAQGGDRRLWLLVGVVGGVTFWAHVLIGFTLLALAATIRRRGPLVAGAIALVIGSPYLIWQAGEGWPQLEVASSIAGGGSGSSVERPLFLVLLVLQNGPWLAPVWVTGLVRGLRRLGPNGASLRPIAMSLLMLTAVFVVVGGKPYYLAGFVPILLAAGAQPVIDRVASWVPPTLLALSLPGVVFALPVLPVSALGPVIAVNPEQGETVGWPSFAEQVEAVLPPGHIVLTGNYGEAGALQRYTDLPVFSGHNGYGLWQWPPGSTPALLVGMASSVPDLCAESALVGRIEMPIENDEDQASLYTCTPVGPWAELWPLIRFLG